MIIRNTPSVLRMMENVVIHLSKELQLPERLEHVPINIRTIYSDAVTAVLKGSLVDLDLAIAYTYADVALVNYSNDRCRARIDSELLAHVFTKMCVLEFLKWISGSKERRECLGIPVGYSADFCKNMIDTFKTEYISILHNYGLWKNVKTSKPTNTKKKTTKPTDTKKKTTKSSKSTSKSTKKDVVTVAQFGEFNMDRYKTRVNASIEEATK